MTKIDLQAAAPDGDHAAEIARLREAIVAKLNYAIGKTVPGASDRDWFMACALAVRDRIVDGWRSSYDRTNAAKFKRVYYMSLEFLIGRLLFDGMTNLGMVDDMREALASLGVDLDQIRALEPDAALGNGGLGRLAACFMESMATLAVPAYGYGIRYDHGLFRQIVKDGWQHENCRRTGWPMATRGSSSAPRLAYDNRLRRLASRPATASRRHDPSRLAARPKPMEAVAYDTPGGGLARPAHVNTLRLWSARAIDALRLDAFNAGDYLGALADRVRAESISKVLYPFRRHPGRAGAAAAAGVLLRVGVTAGPDPPPPQAIWRDRHPRRQGRDPAQRHPPIHRGGGADAHPAGPVTRSPGTKAWTITQATLSYTNHTLLPEALETWPVPLMERLLPRHMQLIYLINAVHLDGLRTDRRPPIPAVLSKRVADRRAMGSPGQDGHTRLCGRPQGQRRVGPSHRPDAANGVSRPPRHISRPHHQQNQRHHVPPLALRRQSGPHRGCWSETAGARVTG